MNNIRLIGKIGEREGIVIIRSFKTSSIWLTELDMLEPTNLNLAKLKLQLR